MVDAALRTQRGVAYIYGFSQHYYLLMEPVSCDHGLDYGRTTTTTTTTTAALEARNLKTAYQVYIVDYYYTLGCCSVIDYYATR